MFRTITFVMAAMAVASLPSAAQAQSPPGGNVAVSYSFERLFDDGQGLNMPGGWLVSAAKSLGNTPLSVVGEFGARRSSRTARSVTLPGSTSGSRFHSEESSPVNHRS
jgi:hypothetical protein